MSAQTSRALQLCLRLQPSLGEFCALLPPPRAPEAIPSGSAFALCATGVPLAYPFGTARGLHVPIGWEGGEPGWPVTLLGEPGGRESWVWEDVPERSVLLHKVAGMEWSCTRRHRGGACLGAAGQAPGGKCERRTSSYPLISALLLLSFPWGLSPRTPELPCLHILGVFIPLGVFKMEVPAHS